MNFLSLAFFIINRYHCIMFSRYVFMILLLMVVGYISYPSPPAKLQMTKLPEIHFAISDSEIATLADYKGTLTLVHFWATWCPPCLVEMPELITTAKENPSIKILAFSLDKSKQEMYRYFQTKFKALPENFIPIWDEGGNIAQNEFYSFNYPETFIIGCSGNIEEKVIGAASNWQRTLKPHLDICKTAIR